MMRSKLLIDGLPMLGQASGVGRYCHEICSRLPSDRFDLYYYYGYVSRKKHVPAADSALSRLKHNAGRLRLFKSAFRKCSSLVSRLGSWDLHWQPNFIPLPAIRASHVVTTVHDFSWELHAQFHPEERIAYFRKYFYPGIETSDRIITVSHFVKAELLERLPHLAGRVEVIHNGFDSSVYAPAPEPRPGKYLLSVGSIEPRKNLISLLQAYALLAPAIRKAYPLLLIGAAGWKNDEILRKVAELQGDVRYLGYVSNDELAEYYRGALGFVYPSLYEGFGLPPIEAMACGTPVITSNVSSLPEVCGDAAYYVDPGNVEAIRAAMQAFVEDQTLRETYARRGLARATRYSWDRSAAAHVALFRQVTGS